MKNSVLKVLAIIGLFTNYSTNAQEIKSSLYSDAAGPSLASGMSVSMILTGFSGDIEIGGFYEVASQTIYNGDEAEGPREFRGVNTSISMMAGNKVDVGFNLKAGFENQSTAVYLLPALTAEYYLTPKVSVGGSAVLRDYIPTGQLKVSFYTGNTMSRRLKRAQYAMRRTRLKRNGMRYVTARF